MTMLALERGPQYLDTELFRGSEARIVAGMKVHANTISHGRLLALEETFPRTRRLMGDSRFNMLSRQYLEERPMSSCSLSRIGANFPRFLNQVDAGAACADMARFEWLWLESYHAADAKPLTLADLAGIAPADLMAVSVSCHPAAQIERFGRSLHRELGREAPMLERAHAILLTRPANEVLVHAASPTMLGLLSIARTPITFGILFSALAEPRRNGRSTAEDLMTPIASLLQAGALVMYSRDAIGRATA